jgi:hypothetical protein
MTTTTTTTTTPLRTAVATAAVATAAVATAAVVTAAWAGMGEQAGGGAVPDRRQFCHATGATAGGVAVRGEAVAVDRAATVFAEAPAGRMAAMVEAMAAEMEAVGVEMGKWANVERLKDWAAVMLADAMLAIAVEAMKARMSGERRRKW